MPITFSPVRPARARRRAALLLVLALGLAAAGAALAADSNPTRLNAADQALAKSVVLRRADLGSAWRGGFTRPDTSGEIGCGTWQPKVSDLVTTGRAASKFTAAGLQLTSRAEVLESESMVGLDWRRTVLSPRLLGCLRKGMASELAMQAAATIVSLKRMPFPRVTSRTAGFRTVIDYRVNGTKVRLLGDFVLMGAGRTEVVLTLVAPYVQRAAAKTFETRLAQLMAARTAE